MTLTHANVAFSTEILFFGEQSEDCTICGDSRHSYRAHHHFQFGDLVRIRGADGQLGLVLGSSGYVGLGGPNADIMRRNTLVRLFWRYRGGEYGEASVPVETVTPLNMPSTPAECLEFTELIFQHNARLRR